MEIQYLYFALAGLALYGALYNITRYLDILRATRVNPEFMEDVVIVSIPPHLLTADEKEKLKSELAADTSRRYVFTKCWEGAVVDIQVIR